ncbi:MAG TPA: acyl-CoA thioesterase domain-containing protein [Acidimicrobiales bacterium]|nr:acyl-CoA thioesterase domain-containing protein [Acidimicrobiales bacterium]
MAEAPDWDVDKERADHHTLLTGVKPGDHDGEYVGVSVEDGDHTMFGGAVIGQAITAITRNAPEGRRLHSLHAYFLRPSSPRLPIEYRVTPLRDGRAYSSRRLTASQSGKVVLEAMGSLTSDTDGFLYDLPHQSELPARDDGERGFGMGGFEAVYFGATEQRSDGTYESTERKWFRMPADSLTPPIGDDIHLHTAYFGMASDWTGMGSRPLAMDWQWEEGSTGPPVASLDHAVWFHRPARVTDWHLLDLHSLVNYGGRGQIRLTIRNEAGEVVVSMAQELLLR